MSDIEQLFPADIDPADLSNLTAEEVAGIEFDAMPEVAHHTKAERIERARNLIRSAGPTLVAAIELLAMDQAQMLKLVRNADDIPSWLPIFGRAAEDALAICEMIYTAQTRLAIAIAAAGDGRAVS
jgi:hypothetical protein